MKLNVLRILIILSLAMSTKNFCYIYQLSVVEKPCQNSSQKQIIILLSDYHDKKHAANKKQRELLEQLLATILVKCKLIVEDLSSVNNDGRMICCNYAINCADGVLGQLANKARQMGIVVDNVEYRYCRVASIGPLLNSITTDPRSVRSAAGITIAVLHKEIANEIEKIKQYNDGKKLNRFYKRSIATVRDTLPKLCLCKADRMTVACYCAERRTSGYREKLEKLCIFDSALIDSNIMHSIACSTEPIIFVVAGGSHIEQVNKWLHVIGYKQLLNIAADQSVNPIDISVIERFVH